MVGVTFALRSVRSLRPARLVACLCSALLAVPPGASAAEPAAPATPTTAAAANTATLDAQVKAVNGRVLIRRAAEALVPEEGAPVKAGDLLIVLTGGEIQVQCPHAAVIRYNEAGSFRFAGCTVAAALNPRAAAPSVAPPAPEAAPPPPTVPGGAGVGGGTAAVGESAASTYAFVIGLPAALALAAVALGGGGGSAKPVSP